MIARTLVFSSAMVIGMAAWIGCGGKKSGGDGGDGGASIPDKVTTSGRLAVAPALRLTEEMPNAGIAFPISPDGDPILYMEEFAIAADGSFSVELDKRGDNTLWVLVSYVKSGDKFAEGETFKFLGLRGTRANLVGLPLNSAKSNIDMGIVTIGGDTDATSEKIASTEIFDLTSTAIDDLSDVSELFKMVKNLYMNTHEGYSFAMAPQYNWRSNDQFNTDPGQKTLTFSVDGDFSGSTMRFSFNGAHGITVSDLCSGAKPFVLEPLTPPEGGFIDNLDNSTDVYEFSNFSNSTMSSNTEGNNCWDNRPDGEKAYFFIGGTDDQYISIWAGSDIETELTGIWQAKFDNNVIAKYDLNVLNQFAGEGAGEYYRYFLPEIKFSVDGDKKVSDLQVRLKTWNGSEYVIMEDVSAFNKIADKMMIGFYGTEGEYCTLTFANTDENVFTPVDSTECSLRDTDGLVLLNYSINKVWTYFSSTYQ